jgi:hypothetical protein
VDTRPIKQDIIFFDDGEGIKRKAGSITKIEDGLIFFSEYGKLQLIPVYRVIRIEKGGFTE